MSYPWFKFYGGEYLSDPKIISLDAYERSCWITLLALASQNNGEVRYLDIRNLLKLSGIEQDILNDDNAYDNALNVLEKFSERQMITQKDGIITITNWRKRQEKSLTGYERLKRYREKHKNDNVADNAKITLEEDIDIEEDIDNTYMSEEDFNTFWELYPRHESKAKAKSKFLKLEKELLPTILEAVKNQCMSKQWQKDNGQFIPHPTTWLNGRRWEDEIEQKELDVSERRILV